MSEAIAAPVSGTFERAGASPSEAFEALYRRSFPRVYGYVAAMLRDRAAAEEVTAQAFERAYRRRRSFRASRGTEEAWLFGIARNAALDELRRRRRRAAMEHEPVDLTAPGAEEQAEDALRREAVRAALARLEPRERELVALRFFGGLSHEEIGRVLGISPSNAGTRVHRALEKLRRECDEDA
ncbi:MAG TPA: sigma-70 family RNA polymerase sigma factor [Thermoleophilaceae bacterium]|nr:sigma-70 family RNA polymerase sigma factor [Thermoleophilaceae bacterium]